MYYNLFSLLLFASFSSESQKKEESMNNFCVEEFLSLSLSLDFFGTQK